MWSYNYNVQNELYHYGVLGMKWGHRKNRYYNSDGSLTNRGQKIQAYRDKVLREAKNDVSGSYKLLKSNKTALSDISKNGKASKYVREYYNDHKGLYTDNKKYKDERGFVKDFSQLSKNQKKQVRDAAISRYNSNVAHNQKTIQKGKAIINNIKNTPIGKTSYAEAVRKRNVITAGTSIVGTVLGGYINTKTNKNKSVGSSIKGGVAGYATGAAAGYGIGTVLYNPNRYLKR